MKKTDGRDKGGGELVRRKKDERGGKGEKGEEEKMKLAQNSEIKSGGKGEISPCHHHQQHQLGFRLRGSGWDRKAVMLLSWTVLAASLPQGGGLSTPPPISFRSRPSVYREEVGGIAVLLCKVNNLGDSIIVWKQKDRIISAGMELIRKDKRMSLLSHREGVNLQIKSLTTDDAGNYICEVENEGEPILQTNTLQILVPPRIATSHKDQNLTVRKDSSLTLTCNASGFPPPRIFWERQHQMLPSGEKRRESDRLVFASVSRSDAGTYICTANNDVGPPVTAVITCHVIYPPEIEVDKAWVHGGVGEEAVLSCLVWGSPPPSLRWYRDTMVLDRNEDRLMEQFGLRHRLVLASVKEQDFGNYSCFAENELGKSRGFIELSGNPNQPEMKSEAQGMFSDRYNLSWVVDSYSPITGYRIIYRKSQASSNPVYDVRSRWHNIVLPDISGDRGGDLHLAAGQDTRRDWDGAAQRGSYVFFALEPNTQYQVRVQARNAHGWGGFSNNFTFSTRATGDIPKELPVEVHSSGITDAGGGQGLGLVSGGGRLHGSLGYSGLFLLVVSLALIGPTYKIEASHWLREAKGACFVLPHLLRTVFFSLNQLVQFVFESSVVMAVAHLAWPSLDFLSEDVFWFRTSGLPGNKNSVLSLDLIL